MKILAIETSCDETAIAVVKFHNVQRLAQKGIQKHSEKMPKISILSNIISSQIKTHQKFGGVVPNLAKREHQKNLPLVLLKALKYGGFPISKYQFPISKKISKDKLQMLEKILDREPELLKRFKKHVLPLKPPVIDAIAVTYGPGLAPALWVGVNFARVLAVLWGRPLIPVNHMAGHAYSAWLQVKDRKLQIVNVKFPALALLVSGGHTELVLMRGHGKFRVIGETLDDAAGEAFDKVARILGLGYPGGPEIERLAKSSEALPRKICLPRPIINSPDHNFSFSGLKTAVLYLTRDLGPRKTEELKAVIAKEFQDAVVEVLVKKTITAAKKYKVKAILLGGGVAANKMLRKKIAERTEKELPGTSCQLSIISLTGDNALMIALAAFFVGKKKPPNKVGVDANLKLS